MPYVNDIVARILPWRKATDLHREMGARMIAFPNLVLAAGVPLTLFDGIFGPDTIDRIAGVILNFGGVAVAANITLSESISGYAYPIVATGHPGNYATNIPCVLSRATVKIVSNVAITAAMNAYVGLTNVELPASQQGHLG